MKTETEQRTHHSYSPSTLQSLEACPCYRGKESTHERTIAGTIAHAVTDSRQDDNRLSDDDAEAAAECLDFYEGRRQLMEADRKREVERLIRLAYATDAGDDLAWLSVEKETPFITELLETYLPVDDIRFDDVYTDPLTRRRVIETVEGTTAGYVDRALISHDKTYAELFDWKFGLWPVEDAKNNLQGIAYSLGLFRRYPTLQRVKFWFKQPHIDAISSADFTRESIPSLYWRVRVVVARAREARYRGDFSTAVPATPICQFCALIGVCPKVAAFACKIGSKFYPLEIPENITPTMIHTSRDTTLGMRLAAVVSTWAEAFRRQTTDRVLRGDADVPTGFKVESSQKRSVVNVEKFRITSLKFVTESEYSSLQDPPGFGKIEELIKDKNPRGQKKAAIETFKNELESSGAVVKSPAFSYLKAVSVSDTNNKQKE